MNTERAVGLRVLFRLGTQKKNAAWVRMMRLIVASPRSRLSVGLPKTTANLHLTASNRQLTTDNAAEPPFTRVLPSSSELLSAC